MTIPYNARERTCFKSFIKQIKLLGIPFSYKEINFLHKNFYRIIKNNLKKYLYERSDDYKNNMIYYRYLKIIEKFVYEYKVQYRGVRDKYCRYHIKYIYDHRSTIDALEANNLHYLDSLLVKYLIQKQNLITIHDCYGVNLDTLHILMDEINTYYNKYIDHEYSLFILK